MGEIAYLIGETAFLRQSFGAEAINAIIWHFAETRVFRAEIHPQNIASIKTIEKCGFSCEKSLESGFLVYKLEKLE